MGSSTQVDIYGTETCGYCTAARMLLKKKGVNYTDILVSTNQDAMMEMRERTGRTSVPQIFINGTAIGGFDELYALEQSGELDKLLVAPAGATDD